MNDITAPEFLEQLAKRGVTMSRQGFKQSVLPAMQAAGAARQTGASARKAWLINGDSVELWLDYLVWFNANKPSRGRGIKYDIAEFLVTKSQSESDKL
jgi:hypothetical protein